MLNPQFYQSALGRMKVGIHEKNQCAAKMATSFNNTTSPTQLSGMKNGYRLSAATGLHKGDRDQQQDQAALLAHPRVEGCVLGVVADGMGGRTGGRKAADQVLMTARQLFERHAPGIDDPAALLKQIGEEAHLVIKLNALAAEQEPHSTLAVFIINTGGECHWLHSGDSRLYHFSGGTLLKRSIDHSYVQTLMDQGKLTAEEALTHPHANALTSCLGTEATLKMETYHIPELQIGDSVLACSDGLWHFFTPEELGEVLQALPPRKASEFLVAKARSRAMGGGDNISLVIAKVEPPVTEKRSKHNTKPD